MKQIKALARKEFLESRVKLLVSLGVMVAIAVSLPILFDWVRDVFMEMDAPERWAETITTQMGDYRIYLWGNWWGKNHSQTMLVLAMIWGMGIIARERENGVLACLLSRPVTRGKLLAVKFAAGAISLSLTSLASTMILLATSWLSRGDGIPWFILRAWPQAALVIVAVFALTTLFSTLLRDRVMALLASLGTTVVVTALGFIAPLRHISPLYLMSAPRALMTGRQDLAALAGLAVVTAALYSTANHALKRMEL